MWRIVRAACHFIHWGPLSALGIIVCITIVTLYMNSMWWPPNESFHAFLHQLLFLTLSSMTLYNFVMAAIIGPQFLPTKWQPQHKSEEEYLQYCTTCDGFKAPRSHHCRKCNRCVIKMDHHCPWINHCVGWANHAYFIYFLSFAVIGCTQATIILIAALYRGVNRQWYLYHGQSYLATVHFGLVSFISCIFSLGLAIGVVIAVGMLLYFQLRAVVRNRTAIEDWIFEKARYRREGPDAVEDEFIYPYDLGVRNNITQVMNLSCEPVGDGVSWPVAPNCDQFTLTREQIAQKAEKRARTRTYTIVHRVTGAWLPIFSQGLRVSLSPPLTDEPRIALNPGDVVRVTRWRRHWLFGERFAEDQTIAVAQAENKRGKKRRTRGWFPRRCAVEFTDNDDCCDREHFNAKKLK